MIVVDLSQNTGYQDLWHAFKMSLIDSNDQLYENYLELDPKSFECFPAVIENNNIVCFSGLKIDRNNWGDSIARCSTRLWIHPAYRQKGMSKFTGGDRFLNTTYCLPLQLKRAREIGIECLFISREKNKKGFQEYLKLIDINCNHDFKLQEQKYNIYSCEQFVAVCSLSVQGLKIWSDKMSKYKL